MLIGLQVNLTAISSRRASYHDLVKSCVKYTARLLVLAHAIRIRARRCFYGLQGGGDVA